MSEQVPATDRCPGCGAALPAAACPICEQLGRIGWLVDESRLWPSRGLADRATAERIGGSYAARRRALISATQPGLEFDVGGTPPPPVAVRPQPAPVPAAPAPPPEPKPPAPPSEWDRLWQATGQLGWLYAVGVLFITAALSWLVITSFGTPYGRMVLAGVMIGLTGAFLAGGWAVSRRLRLETGGEALLAVGSLLLPGALFAGFAALGLAGDGVAFIAWAASAASAALLAWRLALPSQIAVANLCAVPAALGAARGLLPDGAGVSSLALFVPVVAAADLGLAWRCRGLADARRRTTMVGGARASAMVLSLLAAIMLLAGVDQFTRPGADAGRLLGALLLGGSLIGLAFETDRPALIGVAGGAWFLFGLAVSGIAGLGALGDAAAVVLLLGVGWVAREREDYLAWCFAPAAVITTLLVGRWLPAYLERDIDPATVLATWLLAGVYASMAMAWRRRRLISAAVVLACVSLLFGGAAFGLALRWDTVQLAGLAGVLMGLGWRLRPLAWDDRPIGGWLADLALIPLVLGLACGLAAAVFEPFGLVLPAGLGALAALGLVQSLQVGRREVLYLTVAHGAAAAVITGLNLAIDVNAPFCVVAWGLVMIAVALVTSDHFQPFEVSGLLMTTTGAALALGGGLAGGATVVDVATLALAAAGLALLTMPAPAQRSRLPELASAAYREWAALLAGAGALELAGQLAGWGWAVGAAGAALACRLAALTVREGGWSGALAGVATAVAVIAGFACWDQPVAFFLAQAALLLGAGERREPVLVAWIQWVAAQAWWLGYGAEWLRPALDAALALGYLSLARRNALAPPLGAVVLAVVWGRVGQLLGVQAWGYWFAAMALILAGLGVGLGAARLRGKEGVHYVAGALAVGTLMHAVIDWRVIEANVLMYVYCAVVAGLSYVHRLDVRLPLGLLHLAAAFTAATCWVPADGLSLPEFGLRLAGLGLADALLAGLLRDREVWLEALLQTAAAIAVVSFVTLLLPPERASVIGLILLAGGSFASAWLIDDRRLWDAGFGCAWLALAFILTDAARHGREELYAYRSLDLYGVPLSLYLLMAVAPRAEDPRAVRAVAVLLGFGSLLIAAFAGASPLHDVALFCAVAAAGAWGLQAGDTLAVRVGLSTFVLYLAGVAWQYRAASRWLLVPVLLAVGGGVIVYALRQERAARDAS